VAGTGLRGEERRTRQDRRGTERRTRQDRRGKERKTRQDVRTRDRLIEVAAERFADDGFKKVTVREICARARANVAAINYHFGGKDGLYRAVIQRAIHVMRETNDLSIEAGRGTPPEARLRAYIHVFLSRLSGRDRLSWIHKLMTREVAEPGDAMRVVMREVLEPRMHYLVGLASEVSGVEATDPRVLRAVLSIQGQIFVFARSLPPSAPAAWTRVMRDPGAVADHIATFSLAALRGLSATPPSSASGSPERRSGR
jgi:TetR/AcrR family transcriptional regulator, regulator of cefoperazone and chloramphenicol sensitivity